MLAGNADKFNRQLHISRDVDTFLGELGEVFNLPNHRANIVARDNIADYPQDIRDELGDPVFVKGAGYVYVLEDLRIADHKGVYRLHPGVNQQLTLDDYINETRHLKIHQTLPDDYKNEDILLRNYAQGINADKNNSPKYPDWETVECIFNKCSDDFYNSNTSADTRLENANIPVPKSSVIGGLR